MKTPVLVLLFVVALVASAFAAVYAWVSFGDVQMSIHGFLAMGLGVFFSLVLGAGLMFLVFYSSRHGHDDDPKRPD